MYASTTCPICFERLTDRPYVAQCGHVIHKKCAAKLHEVSFPLHPKCCMCKATIIDPHMYYDTASRSQVFKDVVIAHFRRIVREHQRARVAKKTLEAKMQRLQALRAVKKAAKCKKARTERLIKLNKVRHSAKQVEERDARAARRNA